MFHASMPSVESSRNCNFTEFWDVGPAWNTFITPEVYEHNTFPALRIHCFLVSQFKNRFVLH